LTDLKQIVAELEQRLLASLVDRDELLQQQAATNEVLQVINASSGDLAPVFDAILERAMRLCEAEFGLLSTCDGGQIRTVSTRGVPPGFAEFRKNNPPVYGPGTGPARILAGERVVHIVDLKSGDAYRTGDPNRRAVVDLGGARTVLLVPLLKNEFVIGFITIYRKEVRPYSDKQIALLQTFADQAVIAIENARLFNETKEALERQTATAEILKVIASSPSDVQPVFDAIAASANRLLGGFSSTVFRFIDGMAHLKAFTPTTPEADEILQSTFPRPVADFATFQMTQAGEVMQIPDTEAPTYELKEIARARGYRSMLFAPLMNKGVSNGSIAVTRVQPGTFPDYHVQLLRTFADQAVIAIENARLFDEVQAKTGELSEALQQQTATAEVLKAISRSAFDLESVLTTLTVSAKSLCGAASGVIFRREGNLYRYAASHMDVDPAYRAHEQRVAIQADRGTLIGRVALEKGAVQIADAWTDPEYEEKNEARLGNVRAMLGVPLMLSGEPIGAFALARREPMPFSQREVELVTTFADQAVIAIENARLFDEVQRRTRELSLSLEELRTAQDRLVQTEKLASLGQLTAGIAHEIKNPLNFVNNFSALSIELIEELKDVVNLGHFDGDARRQAEELTGLLKSNLEKVVQHGGRADSIVKNMLLHSRTGSGEHRSTDINALVEESLNLAYHGARAERPEFSIVVQQNLDPDAGAAELYPQEITRVLLNLISNGFYAATKRKIDGDKNFEATLSATTRDLGNQVEIRIRDNGTGIPLEVKDKIFNPFFTTKPAGEGTGLGLSMSHDIIVKQHGGKIEVDTKPSLFTEFIITLPRKAAARTHAGESN
jgi:two-component system NtrC family sensor kinase